MATIWVRDPYTLTGHLLSLCTFGTTWANSPSLPHRAPVTASPEPRLPPTTAPPSCSCSLASVELSEQSLEELRAVRTAKPGLVITHPGLDNHPELSASFSSAL